MERMAIKGFKSYVNKVDGIIHYYDLKRPSNRIGIVLIYIACCIMAVVFLFPVLWMVCAALKDEQQLMIFPEGTGRVFSKCNMIASSFSGISV